mmetsp:Transcript_9183/g.15731  ORF Transcript_9183/g.15731 Transcript_9183/m.15731 type:complete len:86 (-) Transcript_9183:493-750(-)
MPKRQNPKSISSQPDVEWATGGHDHSPKKPKRRAMTLEEREQKEQAKRIHQVEKAVKRNRSSDMKNQHKKRGRPRKEEQKVESSA